MNRTTADLYSFDPKEKNFDSHYKPKYPRTQSSPDADIQTPKHKTVTMFTPDKRKGDADKLSRVGSDRQSLNHYQPEKPREDGRTRSRPQSAMKERILSTPNKERDNHGRPQSAARERVRSGLEPSLLLRQQSATKDALKTPPQAEHSIIHRPMSAMKEPARSVIGVGDGEEEPSDEPSKQELYDL
mgnify:CR=1 FL=1